MLTVTLSVIFRERFDGARQRAGLSLATLGRISSNSASKLQSIAKGQFDNSKDGPGLFGVYRAATSLDVTLDQLAPPENTKRPGVNAFLSCFRGVDTPIEYFGSVLDFCDVYRRPRSGSTQLDRLGSKSLLVEVSGMQDTTLLQIEYDRWPARRRRKIYDRQRMAWDRGYLIDSEIYDAEFVETLLTSNFSLLMAACRVRDTCGQSKLLIYAEPLRQERSGC